ncbi:MAG: GNAT family N-acetyltransferase [Bacteroidaceae bacterium]|nr:GNAT family N-acetyltransferase [Bacteroidaceae bacterium]
MHKGFFIGEQVRLRAMEPQDVEVLYEMENDPASWDVSNFSVPYSRHVLSEYIAQSQSDLFADRQLRLMIVRGGDGEVVGTIDLTDFSAFHRRGEVGIAIREAHQGHGYAKEALQLFADYAFRFLRLKQLNAHVAADNAHSLSLFQSCGFEQCGILKAWWRVEGEYKDVVMLQRLRIEN